MRRGLLATAAAMVVFGAPAVAAESDRCSIPYISIAHPPGPPLSSDLRQIKRLVPVSSHCFDRRFEDCEFVDVHGYLNFLGDFRRISEASEAEDRTLFMRIAERSRNAKSLPYGVVWSDRQLDVVRRLKALKQSPDVGLSRDGRMNEVSVGGCWNDPLADGFWTNFQFGSDGRLQRVEQMFHHY